RAARGASAAARGGARRGGGRGGGAEGEGGGARLRGARNVRAGGPAPTPQTRRRRRELLPPLRRGARRGLRRLHGVPRPPRSPRLSGATAGRGRTSRGASRAGRA